MMRDFKGLLIERLVLGMIDTNTYILVEPSSGEAAVVDPADQGERLAATLKQSQSRLTAVLLTHGHFDHIGGAEALARLGDSEVWIHPLDQPMARDPVKNFSSFLGIPVAVKGAFRSLEDGMEIAVGKVGMRVVHTPGHTSGSVCFIGDGFVLSGDTLFHESVGRTDLGDSSAKKLVDSIQSRLMDLADETVVFPGHGCETTIGHERVRNPFLK